MREIPFRMEHRGHEASLPRPIGRQRTLHAQTTTALFGREYKRLGARAQFKRPFQSTRAPSARTDALLKRTASFKHVRCLRLPCLAAFVFTQATSNDLNL